MSESNEMAYNVALCWFEGKYTQEQAQLTCELQGIDFNHVKNEYGNIYAQCENEANKYGH